ncbi:MAG: hypothetical protein ACYCTB_10790 [bacterium]
MKIKKKKNNISGFFDSYVINLRIRKKKNAPEFLQSASTRLLVPVYICRGELKKARTRLYNRVKYLKKSEKIEYLFSVTPFNIETLINFALDKSLILTNDGVESFLHIVYATLESQKEGGQEIYEKVTSDISSWFNVIDYLKFLVNEINREHNNNINAIMLLNGSSFFSNYALYKALKGYCRHEGRMIGNIADDDTKKKLIYVVSRFKELNLLYYNVNKGFYSNTALIERENKKNNSKIYGIFLKTETLGIDVLNPGFLPLQEKYKDIVNITVAKI